MKVWIKEHKYCVWLLYWIFFLIVFGLLEKYVEPKYIIHCKLDDWIPFCEVFVIPYFSWFVLLIVGLGYYMFYSKEDFLNLCWIMFGGMTICLAVYAIFPNGLQLRPTLSRDNLCCKWVEGLYRMDTPTNVCPSIHVSTTIAIYEVTKYSCKFEKKPKQKVILGIWALLICLSTVFLKQHSVIDSALGYLLSKSLAFICYNTNVKQALILSKLKSK